MEVNKVIGVLEFEQPQADAEIEMLIQQRQDARKNKDFAQADAIRDQLLAMGIQIEDTAGGTRWKKIR